MVLFNYSARELTAKIVYYGPGLCGKTTNLQFIYNSLPENVKGKMLSLATKTDRTLFFDFLPLDLGEISGMKTRIQLYTVPGQVFYNETRKLVLTASDGIVFVADSQAHLLAANIESFKNLDDNLRYHGMNLKDLPLVLQFNKRDLPSLTSVEELNLAINKYNSPFYESVATTGIGVQDALRAITKLVLINLCKKFDFKRYEEVSAMPEVKQAEPPSTHDIAAASNRREGSTIFPSGEQVQVQQSTRTVVESEEKKIPVGIELSQFQQADTFAERGRYAESEKVAAPPEKTIDYDESEIAIYDDLEEIEIVEEKSEIRPEIETADSKESMDMQHEEPAAIDFELVDVPTSPQARTDTAEKELKVSCGEAQNVTLPVTVELGKDKVQLNLVISFKFEEKKEKGN